MRGGFCRLRYGIFWELGHEMKGWTGAWRGGLGGWEAA